MKKAEWRFIDSEPMDGYNNMAIDEALFKQFILDTKSPIFRLYSWRPVALSLGRFQSARGLLNLKAIEDDNLTVVRRMTGGGAIYHRDELTYSIICSKENLPGVTSVKDSYEVLTEFLFQFYKELGLEASYAKDMGYKRYPIGKKSSICFEGWEPFDIIINGKKIGGNAQAREKEMVFQHGSIPLSIYHNHIYPYFMDGKPEIESVATSLNDEGVLLDIEPLKELLSSLFAETMEITLNESSLSSGEESLKENLIENKYTRKEWNLDRRLV